MESHVSGIGAILILHDSAPSLNAVSRDKKSAGVRQADGPTIAHFRVALSLSIKARPGAQPFIRK